jgi:hypothetical protein
VPWTDVNGESIVFDRLDVFERCKKSVARTSRGTNSLISVFAAVMDIFAEANEKLTWICKSMG